ncbi:MAG: DUF2894 domain-containing protein [Haliea sp.]|nr:MAG: DUF2894 domain-containing protein [Haliea sp.]
MRHGPDAPHAADGARAAHAVHAADTADAADASHAVEAVRAVHAVDAVDAVGKADADAGAGAVSVKPQPDAASPQRSPAVPLGPLSPSPPSPSHFRDDAGHLVDPVRRFYREALSRRALHAEGKLQQLLQARLDAKQQHRAHAAAPMAAIPPAASPHAAPLTGLNDHIRQAAQPAGAGTPGNPAPRGELSSVRRFRQVWSRIAAADQVDRSLERGPANAGPLNSHMLVLRSLALMQALSPDYLRRFMSQVESLLWLEGQGQAPAPAEVKPVRRSRSKKQGEPRL